MTNGLTSFVIVVTALLISCIDSTALFRDANEFPVSAVNSVGKKELATLGEKSGVFLKTYTIRVKKGHSCVSITKLDEIMYRVQFVIAYEGATATTGETKTIATISFESLPDATEAFQLNKAIELSLAQKIAYLSGSFSIANSVTVTEEMNHAIISEKTVSCDVVGEEYVFELIRLYFSSIPPNTPLVDDFE